MPEMRHRSRGVRTHARACWLASVSICVGGIGHAQSQDHGLTCTPTRVVEILGGARLKESVRLPAAGSYVVRIAQSDADIRVEISNEGRLETLDLPTWRDGVERAVITVAAEVSLPMSLESKEFAGHKGHAGLSVCRVASDPRAVAMIAAERRMTEGARFFAERSPELAERAKTAFSSAEQQYAALGLGQHAAFATYARGMLLYWPLGENEDAAEVLQIASAELRRHGNETLAANSLARAGAAQLEAARRKRSGGDREAVSREFALARHRSLAAARIQEGLGRRFDHALSLNDVGMAHQYEGHFDLARPHYARALETFERLGEIRQVIMVRQNLAAMDFQQGEFASAQKQYLQIEPSVRRYGDADQVTDVVGNLAVMYSVTDRPDKALAAYAEAMKLQDGLTPDSKLSISRSNYGLAGVYMRMGQPRRALEYFREARRLRNEIGDGVGEASMLIALGDAHRELGEFRDAEAAHARALELTDGRSDREKGGARLSLALDCVVASQMDCARRHLGAVLELPQLSERHPIRVRALEESAVLAGQGFTPDRALEMLARADEHFAAAGSAGDVARVNYRAAGVALEAGWPDRALQFVSKSIHQIEAVRGRTATPEVRARWLANAHAPYELRTEVLLASVSRTEAPLTGADRAAALDALLASDAPRARYLLELLDASSPRTPTARRDRARAERQVLYTRLAGLRFRQDQLLEKPSRRADEEELLASVRYALGQVRTALDRAEGQIASGSDGSSAPVHPDRSALELWMRTLPPNRRVVEYFLGERESAVWVLSRDGVVVRRLRSRAEIEKQLRLLQERLARAPLYADDGGWQPIAADLYGVLVQPIVSHLQGREVVLIPHRALAAVPYEVLLRAGAGTTSPQTAEVAPGVSYVASIATAMLMDRRPRSPPAPRMLAIVADPIFSVSDARFADISAENVHGDSLNISRRRTGPVALARLPGTAIEATRIAALAPKRSAVVFSGFQASRGLFLGPRLEEFRMLHIATHAMPDSYDPQLSALAVAALDERGTASDGLLRMYELRDLSVNADLVVLSACESAAGGFGSDEGFAGLTHTFIAAGARRVIASLWRVPDDAAATLMTEMYRAMLSDGASVEAALAIAQRKLSMQAKWQHPFYWAPFVVMGSR